MSIRIVAIDGTAGSGKSTLGRTLARRLGLVYVNTGLMYRAVAAVAGRDGMGVTEGRALEDVARRLRFDLRPGDPPQLEVEGWPESMLTTLAIDRTVSAVSRHPGVRAALRERQRELGAGGAVMEGRDIGSVVFPEAPVKLFLVADPGERVRRRADDREADDETATRVVLERDALDAPTTPPTPTADALVIDTSDRSVDETLALALEYIARIAPELMA